MRFLSLFSGIEAASVAWHPLGWRAQAFSEIERFPAAVLKHRWPEVPNLGDVTKFKDWPNYESIDLLVGGSPCQSFSVAGLRKGLADPRGNLMLTFGAVAGRYRPRWLVWENVPGVLSSNEGRDFGTFLGMLGQLGYGFAYRVLDAQHFGVPQRRRRVFVVGYFGDWRRAAAVLFERESLRGDSAPSREAREGVAGTLSARTKGGGGLGTDFELGGGLHASTGETSHYLNAGSMGRIDYETETFVTHSTGDGYWRDGAGTLRARAQESHEHLVTHSLRADGFDASEDGTGRGTPLVVDTLTSNGDAHSGFRDEKGLIPIETLLPQGYDSSHASTQEADSVALLRALQVEVGEEAFTEWRSRILDSLQSPEVLRSTMHGVGIRRAASEAGLWMDDSSSPRSESVQTGSLRCLWEEGPDGRTSFGRGLAQQLARESGAPLPFLSHEKAQRSSVRRLTPTECERLMGFSDGYTAIPGAKDGPRYKALGNSMAVPVMRWIGRRIQAVNSI